MKMEAVQEHVKKIEIGGLQEHNNLAIAPLIGVDGVLEHIVLLDALEQNLEIREKGGGDVPRLFATNRTGKNVLAIAGEYLIGGMQNRTIMRNIYFDKEFEGEIPVRCVQHGRWSYGREPVSSEPGVFDESRGSRRDSSVFRRAGHAPLCAFVAESQGATWNAIENILCCEGVRSGSGDLHEVYREKSADFDNYKEKFPVVDNQVGNIAVISRNGDKTFVLDLFDRHEILKKHHGNLVSSYALEAGLKSKEKVEVNQQEVRGFLDSVDSCDFQEQRPVSIGEDYKISGAGLQGSVLLYNNSLAYMNFFNKRTNPGNPGNSVRIPSIREQADSSRFSAGFYRPI